jgi:hypothetical protein
VTIAHRAAPEIGGIRLLCADAAPDPKPLTKPKRDVETAIEFSYRVPADGGKTKGDLETAVEDFLTASPPMGWLLIPVIPVILSTF